MLAASLRFSIVLEAVIRTSFALNDSAAISLSLTHEGTAEKAGNWLESKVRSPARMRFWLKSHVPL